MKKLQTNRNRQPTRRKVPIKNLRSPMQSPAAEKESQSLPESAKDTNTRASYLPPMPRLWTRIAPSKPEAVGLEENVGKAAFTNAIAELHNLAAVVDVRYDHDATRATLRGYVSPSVPMRFHALTKEPDFIVAYGNFSVAIQRLAKDGHQITADEDSEANTFTLAITPTL